MDTLFIGRNIIRLTEVDSTNSYAKALLKDVKAPEGTIVLAETETNGPGQCRSTWIAEPYANITCSLIIAPTFLNPENHFLISKITALAIKRALAEMLPSSNYDIKIKWPNDILVNNKKIAGILIENILRANQISNCIIGFGINVNQSDFQSLNEKACSIKTWLKINSDKEALLAKVCSHFEALYLKLKAYKYEEVNELYLKELLFYGQIFSYNETIAMRKQIGAIENVADNGEIHIKKSDGTLMKYLMKEISYGY